MDCRYQSVCACLGLLLDADLSFKDKLRLETDFIQIKVALLKESGCELAKAPQYDESYFRELLAEIRCLVQKGIDTNDVAYLSGQLQPVISALSGVAPSPCDLPIDAVEDSPGEELP